MVAMSGPVVVVVASLLTQMLISYLDLNRDVLLLLLARAARMASFGALAVVLLLLLKAEGLEPVKIGSLLTLILGGGQ